MQVPLCVALLYHISFRIGCDSTVLFHSGILFFHPAPTENISLHCLVYFSKSLMFLFEQETLHNHKQDITSDDDSYEVLEAASRESTGKTGKNEKTSQGSLLKNWPLMSSIIVYCVLCLHDTAYSEVLMELTQRPHAFGIRSFATS